MNKTRFKNRTLVLLSGPIASGKSTFARKYFDVPVLSADSFREMISGDAGNQDVSRGAFEILHKVIEIKMRGDFPVIVDNLNQTTRSRKELYSIADEFGYDKVVVTFEHVSEEVCLRQNKGRDRFVNEDVLKKKYKEFHAGLGNLAREGVEVIKASEVHDIISFGDGSEEGVYKKITKAAFIGDVHGCSEEMIELVESIKTKYPDHMIVFVGDFADRGPDNAGVLEYIMNMVNSGAALAVKGNHDDKLFRWLKGNRVKLIHGLDTTAEHIEAREDVGAFKDDLRKFLGKLPLYIELDEGKVVVSHAGIDDWMIGRTPNGKIRQHCLYGPINGFHKENNMPKRIDWAAERKVLSDSPFIVYGHQAKSEVYSVNETACIDTACVFGGKLTSFIWPEREYMSVKAKKTYCYDKYDELTGQILETKT